MMDRSASSRGERRRVGVRSRRRGRRAWCGDDAVATMRGGARRARGKG